MPFWPWYMAACVALMIYGHGRGGIAVPALILCGLVGMRGIMWGLDPSVHEVASHALWLCISVLLMYRGAWVPGALCLLSGVTYPTLLVVGVRIEYLGLTPIIADAFLIAAMVAGWFGMADRSHTHADCDRMAGNGEGLSVGMAQGEASASALVGRGMEVKAGQ